jgi:hypothetical protein
LAGSFETKINVERNEMKTMAAFTMALAALVLATAAYADAQGQRCKTTHGKNGLFISIRAGTPCRFWIGRYFSETSEIIERPHEGTAVIRADGRIYYSPRPGFTGWDRMRLRDTDCGRFSHCFPDVAYIFFVQ